MARPHSMSMNLQSLCSEAPGLPLGATPLILLPGSGLTQSTAHPGLPPEQEISALLGLLLRKGKLKTLLLNIN